MHHRQSSPRRKSLHYLTSTALLLVVPFASAQDNTTDTCAYTGGWSLRVDSQSCPPSAPVSCDKGAQPRCCPSGMECAGVGDYVGNYCCAEGSDCVSQVNASPKCPDTDWTLWGVKGQLENGGWCCAADSKGTYWTSSGVSVGCASSANTTLATSQAWAQTISTSSCTATSTSTGTASTSATGSAAATATTAAASEDNGISQAAVAGIAVGSVVGVALVVVGATLLWWRRREAVAAAEDADAVEGGSGAGVPMFEMGNEERVEMDGAQVARARGVKSPTYELEGHKWTPPEER